MIPYSDLILAGLRERHAQLLREREQTHLDRDSALNRYQSLVEQERLLTAHLGQLKGMIDYLSPKKEPTDGASEIAF